jgi:hypothetical protein
MMHQGVAVAIDSAAPRKDEGAGQLATQMPLGQLAAQIGHPQGAGQAAVGQIPSQPPPPGQMAPGQMNPGHMVSGPMAPGQMVGAPPPGHGYANTGIFVSEMPMPFSDLPICVHCKGVCAPQLCGLLMELTQKTLQEGAVSNTLTEQFREISQVCIGPDLRRNLYSGANVCSCMNW